MKRVVSFLLVICMVLGCFPTSVEAASESSQEYEAIETSESAASESNLYDINTTNMLESKDEYWSTWGKAYYSESKDGYVLTENGTYQAGGLAYKYPYTGDFSLEFDYYTGNSSRGADGICVAFYAKQDYYKNMSNASLCGENMCFRGSMGYGVELDTYHNSKDPAENHVALLKQNPENHLAYKKLSEAEDGEFHNLRMIVLDGMCYVYVDYELKLEHKVEETGYGYIFINACTATYSSEQIVKNIKFKIGGFQPLKDDCQCSIKVIDSVTMRGVKNAEIQFGDDEKYITNNEGKIVFSVSDIDKYKGETIIVSSAGYKESQYAISSLCRSAQNTLKLSAKNSSVLNNIVLGEEKINGPTVNIFGKDVTLFTVDVGLDFSNIPGIDKLDSIENLAECNYVKVDDANKTVKIMLGLPDSYKASSDNDWAEDFLDFKNFYLYFSKKGYSQAKNKYNSIRELMNKYKMPDVKSKFAFSCDASVCGYIEADYSTGELKFKEGGFVFIASAGVKEDFPFGPWFYATFGLAGEVEGKPCFKCDEAGNLNIDMTTSLSVKPSLGVGLKLLTKNLASAELGLEGEIKGELSLPANSIAEALTLYLEASAYFRMNILIFEKKYAHQFFDYKLSFASGVEPVAEVASWTMSREDSWEPIPRDYLYGKEAQISLLADEPSEMTTCSVASISEKSVYPDASPKLVKSDDGTVMAVWVTDNGMKSDNNRTSLYFSQFNNGQWTTPEAVYESGKADYYPRVSEDGSVIHIVWQRAAVEFGDDADIDEMLENTELVYSRYENGAFSEPVVISQTTGKYQMEYSIASQNDIVIVSWMENSVNDYTFDTGVTSVYSRIYRDGIWENVSIVSENGHNIMDVQSGFLNGAPVVAYSMADVESEVTDYDLYIGASRISNNDQDEAFVTYQNGKFYWVENGEIRFYNGESVVNTGVVTDDATYTILQEGNEEAIITVGRDGLRSELYISYLTNGISLSPVALSNYGKHIDDYSAVVLNGKIVTLATVSNLLENGSQYSLLNSEDEFPYTSNDMICEMMDKKIELAMGEYVSFDEKEIGTGNVVEFTVEVKNSGTDVISPYRLEMTDTAGTVLASKEYTDVLKSGESKSITIDYVVPYGFTKKDFVFVVYADGDKDSTNNSITVTVGECDVELLNCVYADGILTGEVKNSGYEVASEILVKVNYFDGDEVPVEEFEIGNLDVGESQMFECIIPEQYKEFVEYYESNKFFITVETANEESRYANNEAEILLEPIHVEAVTLDKEQVELFLGYTEQLTATIYPKNAFEQGIIWFSDSTDVATVDSNGLVTGVGNGLATITAMSEDGDIVAHSLVRVFEPYIMLNYTKMTTCVGAGNKMTAVIYPVEDFEQTVIWTSASTDIATVDSKGLVKGVAPGTATITASSIDGKMIANCEVVVYEHTDMRNGVCEDCFSRYYHVIYPRTTLLGQGSTVANITVEPADACVKIGEEAKVTAPEIEGCVFKGWYHGQDVLSDQIKDGAIPLSTENSWAFTPTDIDWPEFEAYIIAVYEAKEETVDYTLAGENFMVTLANGETYVPQDGICTVNAPIGTEVTVVAEDADFIGWMNEHNKIVTTKKEYTFVVTSAGKMIMREKGIYGSTAMVEFVSLYNQVISGQMYRSEDEIIFPDGPSKMGFIFEGWNLTQEDIYNRIEQGETHITVLPKYRQQTDITYTVDVYIDEVLDEEQSLSEALPGSTKILQSPKIEGKVFLYWTDGEGNILGYNPSYFMQINKDIVVKAVYGVEEVDEKPVIAMSNVYTTVTGQKNKISFSVTRSIPKGYTLVEHGIIANRLGYENPTTDNFVLDVEGVTRIKGSDPSMAGVYTLNINMTGAENVRVTARGYIIVRNEQTGEEEIYYSDLANYSYNDLYVKN